MSAEQETNITVWRDYESAAKVLVSGIKSDDRLKSNCQELVQRVEAYSPSHKHSAKPFIVVCEGLDGSGKSSLAKSLGESFPSAKSHRTPPFSVLQFRKFFDAAETDHKTSRAFYCVGNYLAIQEIYEQKEDIAIIDRFYASTLAYGCVDTDVDILPESLFEWPKDLPQPDLTLFLNLTEEAREKRVGERNPEENGSWEQCLKSATKRSNILKAYQRMQTEEIDASLSKEEVLELAKKKN